MACTSPDHPERVVISFKEYPNWFLPAQFFYNGAERQALPCSKFHAWNVDTFIREARYVLYDEDYHGYRILRRA